MRDPDDSSIGSIDPTLRAEIIDRLYDVALDPAALRDLAETWERHLRAVSPDAESPVGAHDAEIEAHLVRATAFLGRLSLTRPDRSARSVLADIPRLAAIISDGATRVLACNRAASVAFHIEEDAPLAALPFEAADLITLSAVIRKVAARRAEKVITLRIRSTITGGPVILRVSPVDSAEARPLALVLSTELVWPEGFAETVQEAFTLTPAEVEIVRGITLGLPIRDIAESRRRSVDTVRTQMRSILAKTETHSQAELVRVVLGLMDVALTPLGPLEQGMPTGPLDPAPLRSLLLPDGRRLDWVEFGEPFGAPCLFLHTEWGLSRWPASAEREAKARGIRVIVPIRAGYGFSDPLPKGVDTLTAVTLDYAAILDHLGVEQACVLAPGADLRFAANLALVRPGLVTGILGCAVRLPPRTAAQHDRMDRWQRFLLANARSSPKMLAFLIHAAFTLARRIGKEQMLALVAGGSPADALALGEPEVLEALLHGSNICIATHASAHEAFTREVMSAQKDWSGLLRACRVPILLLHGDQDPHMSPEAIRAAVGGYPQVEVETVSHSGQLLFFTRWLSVMDRLEDILPR